MISTATCLTIRRRMCHPVGAVLVTYCSALARVSAARCCLAFRGTFMPYEVN